MKPRVLRILLAEDDPVCRAFLALALEPLPAHVDLACTAAEACERAMDTDGHDLWLLDAHLPDAVGPALLGSLREHAPWTPAIAHTGSDDAATINALRVAGFTSVLHKPITAAALQAAVRGTLGHPVAVADASGAQPAWDDAVAMCALRSDRGHVEALRCLFLDELPGQRGSVVHALAWGDRPRATSVLHRLRASCGFVGAVRLEAAVSKLQCDPTSGDALRAFLAAADTLLQSRS